MMKLQNAPSPGDMAQSYAMPIARVFREVEPLGGDLIADATNSSAAVTYLQQPYAAKTGIFAAAK
ncbi:MAG: hypothetical protein ACKOPQ_06780 [Novosphingobium sp.]